MKLVIQVLQILLLISALEGSLFKLKGGTSKESQCDRPYYRSIDGYCNNFEHPDWGTPDIPYVRLFRNYSYEDGLCEMADLPNPRKISLLGFIHLAGTLDPKWNLYTIIWGQLIAHDMGLTYGVPQTADRDTASTCSCISGRYIGKSISKNCDSIVLPKDDPYNAPEGRKCMNFIRTKSTCDSKPGKPAEQINSVNSYIDASFLYGNTETEARLLRSSINGKLLSQTRNGRTYPPPARTAICYPYPGTTETLCLQTGDVRGNQNPYIALGHTILFRYHNNIAEKLSKINKHWNDETIYQETRRIVIATVQHITFYQFLTFILGRSDMVENDIIPLIPSTFHSVYDKNVNPSCINEHATSAFRILHSAIQGFIMLMNQKRQQFGTIRLSNHYDEASLLIQNNTELGLATGCSTEHIWKVDRYYDDEVNEVLFKHEYLLGSDLFAIDVFRARDHGLAFYADAIKECGLGDPKSFDDFEEFISKENVKLLKTIYSSYDKVELRVAAQLEKNSVNDLAGPVSKCIMLKQFYRSKYGDYYWYENEEQDLPFTEEQLESIKEGATISALICNQIDGMKKIQKLGFEGVAAYNPLVPCEDIPTIDLTLWKEKDKN